MKIRVDMQFRDETESDEYSNPDNDYIRSPAIGATTALLAAEKSLKKSLEKFLARS